MSTAPLGSACFCLQGKDFMANIQVNKKDGKIISFRFRVFVGRDKTGRQQFKTKVWKPDKDYTEKRLLKLAEKEAALWERELMQGGCAPIEDKPVRIKFCDFVNAEWLPSLIQ